MQLDIPTQRFTNNMTYQLPFGKGRHWLRGVSRPVNLFAGGWDVSVIYSLYSGQFLTLQNGQDRIHRHGLHHEQRSCVSNHPAKPTLQSRIWGPASASVNNWFNAEFASRLQRPASLGRRPQAMIEGPGVNV